MRTKLSRGNQSYLILRELLASIFFTLGLFSTLSLCLYSFSSEVDIKSSVGTVGIFISNHLGNFFGLSSFLFPIIMIYTSFIVFKNKQLDDLIRKTVSAFLFLISTTCLLGLIFKKGVLLGFGPAGGMFGLIVSQFMSENLTGSIGSYLVVTILIVLSFIILINLSVNDLLNYIEKIFFATAAFLKFLTMELYNFINSSIQDKRKKYSADSEINEVEYSDTFNYRIENLFTDNNTEEILPEIILKEEVQDEKPVSNFRISSTLLKNANNFVLPGLDLLEKSKIPNIQIDKDSIYKNSKLIEDKLNDFGVTGKVTEIRPGPVITMFEYKPSPGIKINKIASLSNDLAMGLSALSIRIIAPIPGKDVIGIEVPNDVREEVCIRDLLEDARFNNYESKLTIALGKDISGSPVYMDLKKAPHLMIAGTTGSGKSVFLHSLITSMLYKSSPDDLKFLMIDPKMLELSIYEDLPHLLHPVVINPKEAIAALKWAVSEMELRYKLLSEEGVRDIETYNKKLKSDEYMSENKPLPYIGIIMDELADLMMVAPGDIKESITRLSQMARAAGIHLIVATQRPSADVVAGLIKANFPARVSFLVSSKIDSRIILDSSGAEQLLGKGDMLYLKPGTSNLLRIQGAFISEAESERVSGFIKEQANPEYNIDITKTGENTDPDNYELEKDELYLEALRIIIETGQASISMLQRKLKIGYNRSARIIEIMEKEGFIGQQESAGKPREVYIDSKTLKELAS